MKKNYLISFQISIVIILLILINKFYIIQHIEKFSLWAFPNDENRNGEVTKLILNIFGGIFVLIGLFAALRRAKSSEKAVEVQSESIKNQTDQIQLTRIAQVNEQFKNAVEHLGSESEPIILGGISELHFIAVDNGQKFRQVVLNILCNKVRSEAHVKKNAESISNTIVQTIIDYIFMTDTYKGLKSDLSHCNLERINIGETHIIDCNLSFSIIPKQLNNVTIRDSNLGSISSTLGRYSNLTIINCPLFHAYFQATTFYKTTILDSNNNLQALICVNSEFNDVKFSCNLYSSTFIACEFENSEFKNSEFININCSGSSFKDIDFDYTEIANCNFSAVGFVNINTQSWIQNCQFKGVKNSNKYYRLLYEKQLDASVDKKSNLNGLNYNETFFIKNDISNLTEQDKINMLIEYEDIIKKQKERNNSR
ncbi:MAG: hypothetical protein CL524_09635 [Aequorivita sp.]|nr:hypothetical protein [Aequorivita sp.]MBF29786.1 hypothetical protein [Aequorivita sp.]|tara:strand:+ start:27374 stop:28648 length:1275 start_codon:yes stop_codon:yes gene_type:complete